jgi:putative hydrolase of HD superfamily
VTDDRLARQLAFVVEMDRLKGILRQTSLIDSSRRENTAEHSWHLAVAALSLAEHAPPGTDLARALHMVLIHDIVEIDAGDTFGFDDVGYLDKEERETRAAERLFGLLPADQTATLRALWDEFEAGATPAARFAVALDRLQPLLVNFNSGGGTWKLHGITLAQLRRRMAPIAEGAPGLWPWVERTIEEACERGYVVRAGPHPAA